MEVDNVLVSLGDQSSSFWHLGLTTDFAVVGNMTSALSNDGQNLIPWNEDLGSSNVIVDLSAAEHSVEAKYGGLVRMYLIGHETSQNYYKFYEFFVDGIEQKRFHCGGYNVLNQFQSSGCWMDLHVEKGQVITTKLSKTANAMTLKADELAALYGNFTRTRFIGIQLSAKSANTSVKGFFHAGMTSDLSIAANTSTKAINLYDTVTPTGAIFDPVANEYTITKPGQWLFGSIQYSQGIYYSYGSVKKNGSEVFEAHLKGYDAGINPSNTGYLTPVDVGEGDVISYYFRGTSAHKVFGHMHRQSDYGSFCDTAFIGIRTGD